MNGPSDQDRPRSDKSGAGSSAGGNGDNAAKGDLRGRLGRVNLQVDGKLFDNHEDGLESAATNPRPEDDGVDPEVKAREIEGIREEGLNPRQKRIIRRVAEVQQVTGEDEFEMLWYLRRKGIFPFKPGGQSKDLLDRALADNEPASESEPGTEITRPNPVNLPSLDVKTAEEVRLHDIKLIQQDIVRRRRRRTLLLFTRLAIFVLIPTLIANYYFREVATKLYETETQFIVQMAVIPGAGSATAASASVITTAADSINVQTYLTSRDAMQRLDRDLGFKSHFSQPQIDPLQRLELDSTREEMFRVYSKMVKIGYDPTEGGAIRMDVSAADPETSRAFSEALLRYAEEQVEDLTERLREGQMKGAREIFAEAEQKMLAAQDQLADLQKRIGTINPEAEGESVSRRIAAYEDEIRQKRLELASILDNPQPNQARVDGVKTDIARLQGIIAELRKSISTAGEGSEESLADLNAEVLRAQAELEIRQRLMEQAQVNLEAARVEADRQTRYVVINVSPTPPDVPTYPRVWENTILTFFVVMGIYLMISLTASILREQISA